MATAALMGMVVMWLLGVFLWSVLLGQTRITVGTCDISLVGRMEDIASRAKRRARKRDCRKQDNQEVHV
jgi:hypothetical protein